MKTFPKKLFIVFVVALGLRLIALESRSIAYDDAFSFFLSRQSLSQIIIGTAADTMPPLYYFILHYWMLISTHVWFLRLLSVILNLGTIGLFFACVNEIAGEKAAFWASLMAAMSPLQIYHAQDIRMYALVQFVQIGYFYCFLRTQREKAKMNWWIGLVLFGTAAFYSHNLAPFALLVPDIWLLWKRKLKPLFHLITAQVVMVVLALPWLIQLPGQIHKIQTAFWTPRPGIVEVLQVLLQWSVNLPLSGIWLVVAAICAVVWPVLAVWLLLRNRDTRQGISFLVLWTVFQPIVLFGISYFMQPVFVARGFLAASLGMYALAGVVIARKRPAAGYLIGGSFLVAAVVSLPFYYSFSSFPRSDYRQTADWIRTHSGDGYIVIHDNKLSYFPMAFYAPDLPQEFLADEPGSSNDTLALPSQEAMEIFPHRTMEAAVDGYQDLFFIVYQQSIEEFSQRSEDHPVVTWLSGHCTELDSEMVGDLLIYRCNGVNP
jgi:hypothetical protein